MLGTFSAGTYFLQSTSSSSIVNYPYTIPGWTSQSTGFTVIVEISGVKTSASTFQVTLTAVSINQVSGLINTQMTLISNPPIESVVITYIAFSSASPVSFTSFNPAVGSTLPYQFVGIDSIQNGATVLAAYGFSSAGVQNGITCRGTACPSGCVSVSYCSSNGGSVISNTLCVMCRSNEQIVNARCVVPVCGQN